MTENLANGYSSKSTRRELSNEYQHDRVEMDSQNICVLVLWTKIYSFSIGRVKERKDSSLTGILLIQVRV